MIQIIYHIHYENIFVIHSCSFHELHFNIKSNELNYTVHVICILKIFKSEQIKEQILICLQLWPNLTCIIRLIALSNWVIDLNQSIDVTVQQHI
jgi:hypothetical protein